MRSFHASTFRDTRPMSMTGCLAALRIAAALSISSAEAVGLAGGMKRAAWSGASGSGGFASCISASRFADTGPRGGVVAVQTARINAPPGAAGGGGLVIPFGKVPNDCALIARRMNPVNPRSALERVHWAGRAEHNDGLPIAPGVEDCHSGVKEPDVGMHGSSHRLASHLCVAVGKSD